MLIGPGLPGDGAGQGRRTVRQTVRAGQSVRTGGWETDGSGMTSLRPRAVLTSLIAGSRGSSRSSLEKNCTQGSQTGKFVIL